MAVYDFRSLSDYEFELLVKDLVEKDLGISLRGFAKGRDGGVDIRSCSDKRRKIIVQAKHFAGSGYPQLKFQLEKKELPKVKLLEPDRYIIATSLALTPGNLDELVAILSPYLLNENDIYDCGRLNDLLSKFPDVEKRHYKLWLTSTQVLEQVLHSRVFNQTEFELQGIKRKIERFDLSPN